MEHSSDYDVIKQVLAGDTDRYEVIMRRYNQRLYRIARSIVLDDGRARDVVQEAHIKAYQKIDKFSGTSGLPAWLSMIVRNEALMTLRKLKPENLLPVDVHQLDQTKGVDMTTLDNNPASPESMLENKQLRIQLNNHIDALPEHFRAVFVMRGVEQLTTRETAHILDLNEITVKTRFFRAKLLLQKHISNQYRNNVYEIGGEHCDAIVTHVLKHMPRQ